MTPQDIEALLRQHGSGHSPDDYDDASEPAGARERRTELLRPVLSACRNAWAARLAATDEMAQKLGDGSRDAAWRLPLGDSGILDFFLGVLAEDGLSQGLRLHALRLVGNSCADTDENRARVVKDDRLSSVIRHVEDEPLTSFTIPVLYNVLVDYEPARLLASQSRLSRKLIARLSSPTLSNHAALVPYFCKILALLAPQEAEPSVADPDTANVLLSLATSSPARDDLDDFASLLSVAVAYLANEALQSRLLAEDGMGLFVEAFYLAHARFDVAQAEDPDSAAHLKTLRTSLLTTLADLSGNDSFPSSYPLSSPVAQSFLAWVQSTKPLLQSAACLVLGNLSRSDEASVRLVEKDSIHVPLIRLLSNPAVSDPQLLHLALSFCKNLAIPPENKARLGDLLDPSCVPRIYSLDTLPQVQFAAISLTRQLLLNCPPNVRRVCIPSSAPSSPDTSVASILSLFDRSDAEPTKLEAARSVASLCRVLHSAPLSGVLAAGDEAGVQAGVQESTPDSPPPSANDQPASHAQTGETRQAVFYSEHNLSRALAFLVTQQKWPALRSEAWFVFALMSRSRDGAAVILAVLQAEAARSALTEAVTGRKASEAQADAMDQLQEAPAMTELEAAPVSAAAGLQLEPRQVEPRQADMTKIDRENALVLCTELLRNCEGELPPFLHGLVREGTELVAAAKC